MTKAKPTKAIDKVIGKVQRALGELTGRPDLVIEGETRDTGLPREDDTAPAPPPKPR